MQQLLQFTFSKSFNGDGLLEGLAYPFVFVPSLMVPKSGGYKYKTGKDTRDKRDEWGSFGPVQEWGSQGSVGVQLAIPGMRNIAARFQGLTFGRDVNNATESQIITAFERYEMICDDRQHMPVELLPAAQN